MPSLQMLAAQILPIAALALGGCASSSTSEPVPDAPVIEMDTAEFADEFGVTTEVVCPGANGCLTSVGALRAGAAARVITPVVEEWTDENDDQKYNLGEPFVDLNDNGVLDGVYLAGFDIGRQANGVHDDMWTRVLVLEQGDTKIALVALDLVGFFGNDIQSLREAVKDLNFDHVLVSSTHVHEVPDTMGIWGKDAGTTGRDPEYIAHIVEESRLALVAANAALTEVSVTSTQRDAPHLIDDSRLPEVKDPTLSALRFTALADDLVIAHWLSFGNHPEALGGDNQLVTSDYPHYLRTAIEDAHPGSTAIFQTGLLGGLMNPLHIQGCPDANGDETCPSGTFELAEYIGSELATLALDGLDNDPQNVNLDDTPLAFARSSLLLPIGNFTFLLAFQLGLLTRDVFLEGVDGDQLLTAERLRDASIDDLTDANLRVATEVSLVRLGQFDLTAIPGELYPELFVLGENGESLIERPAGGDFPDDAFETPIAMAVAPGRIAIPLNNAGDALGYIIPRTQFDRESPRAYEDDGQYGEQNSTGPAAGPLVTEASRRLFTLEVR